MPIPVVRNKVDPVSIMRKFDAWWDDLIPMNMDLRPEFLRFVEISLARCRHQVEMLESFRRQLEMEDRNED
jgi:hypothetical protein